MRAFLFLAIRPSETLRLGAWHHLDRRLGATRQFAVFVGHLVWRDLTGITLLDVGDDVVEVALAAGGDDNVGLAAGAGHVVAHL